MGLSAIFFQIALKPMWLPIPICPWGRYQRITFFYITRSFNSLNKCNFYLAHNNNGTNNFVQGFSTLSPYFNGDRIHYLGAAQPGFFLGGGGGRHSPPLAGCLPPLEILLYIYCNVQHVALAPPGMRKQLFCPPLSKILNAALTANS